MNCRQIFWLAALLTIEAAALSLLNTRHAQASQVYRCDNTYQQRPCADTQVPSMPMVKDPRTPAQVALSRRLSEQDLKAYKQLIRRRQHEIRMAPKAKAVALSSARSGDGPFGATGTSDRTASDGSGSKPQRMQKRAPQHKNLRIAQVPRPAHELQASARMP